MSSNQPTRMQDPNEWDARIIRERFDPLGVKKYLVEWFDDPKPGEAPKTWANEWITADRASKALIKAWENEGREGGPKPIRQRKLRLPRPIPADANDAKRTAGMAFGEDQNETDSVFSSSRPSTSHSGPKKKKKKLFISSTPENSENETSQSVFPSPRSISETSPKLRGDDTCTPSQSLPEESDTSIIAGIIRRSRRVEAPSVSRPNRTRENDSLSSRTVDGQKMNAEDEDDTHPHLDGSSSRHRTLAHGNAPKVRARTVPLQSVSRHSSDSLYTQNLTQTGHAGPLHSRNRVEVMLPTRRHPGLQNYVPSGSQQSDTIESPNFTSQLNRTPNVTDEISAFTSTAPVDPPPSPLAPALSSSPIFTESVAGGRPQRKSVGIMSLKTPPIDKSQEYGREVSPIEDYPTSQKSVRLATEVPRNCNDPETAASELMDGGARDARNHEAPTVDSVTNGKTSMPDSVVVLTQSVVPGTVSDNAVDRTITSQSSSDPSISQQLKSTLDLLDNRNRMINDLRNQKADVEAKLATVLRSSSSGPTSYDDWDVIIGALRDQNRALESELSGLAPAFERQIKALHIQVEELVEKDAQHDHRIQGLTSGLTTMRTELEQVQSSNRQLREANGNLAGTNARLEKSLVHASNDLVSATARIALQQGMITDLRTQVDNLADRLRSHTQRGGSGEIEALQEENKGLKFELAKRDADVDPTSQAELHKALAVGEERIALLTAQTSRDAEELSRLQAALDEEKKLHHSSKDDVEFLRQRYKEASDAAANLGQENRVLEQRSIRATSQANDGVKQAKIFYQAQIQRLEQELDQANVRVAILNKKGIRTVTGNIDTLETDHNNLKLRYELLQQEHVELQKELHHMQLLAEEFKEHVDRLVEVGVDVDYPVEYVIDDVIERFHFLREPLKPFGRLKDIGIDVDLELESFEYLVDGIMERMRTVTNVKGQSPLPKESNLAININNQPDSIQIMDTGLRPTSPLDFSNIINDHDADPQSGPTPSTFLPVPPAGVLSLSKSTLEPLGLTELNGPESVGPVLQKSPSTPPDTREEVFPCPALPKPHELCLDNFHTRDEVKRHILGLHVTLTPYSNSTPLSDPNDASS